MKNKCKGNLKVAENPLDFFIVIVRRHVKELTKLIHNIGDVMFVYGQIWERTNTRLIVSDV